MMNACETNISHATFSWFF